MTGGKNGETVERLDGAWPLAFAGVVESVVTTRGPNGRWNVAALGLHAPRGASKASAPEGERGAKRPASADASELPASRAGPMVPLEAGASAGDEASGSMDDEHGESAEVSAPNDERGDAGATADYPEWPPTADDPVTAVTWGRTRTRRNFERRGGGVVQFVTDPRDFVDAALAVREEETPVLGSAAAWVRVEVDRLERGTEAGTERMRWALTPVEGAVTERRVPAIDRGFNAVVEATVAASRLDVPAYDAGALLDRLDYLEGVVASCGGPAAREAFERVDEYADWRGRR